MRRRAVHLALLIAILLPACQMSSVDPDADVALSGAVVGGSGTGLADQTVVLLTEPTVGDVLFGLPFGLGSLGFACLAEDPPPPCDTRRRTTTDASGGFRFTVTGRETQGLFGDAARMTLSTTSPPQDAEVRGPATTGAFIVTSEQVSLEPLPVVRALPALSSDGGAAVVAWAWQGATSMRGAPGTPEFVFEVAGLPLWIGPAQEQRLDARLLEDVTGSVSIVEQRRADGTIDELTYRSEAVAYTAPVRAPISRGRTCRVLGQAGGAPLTPCPLTDGDLTTRAPAVDACPDGAICTPPSVYEIDLGQTTLLDLVVVRGCDDVCSVDASDDGATWRPIAQVERPFAAAAQAGTARYVRVDGGSATAGFTEVSVWDGPATDVTFAVDRGAGPPPGTGPEGADETGGPSMVVLILLGLAVVAAAVAVGIALGRRRPA